MLSNVHLATNFNPVLDFSCAGKASRAIVVMIVHASRARSGVRAQLLLEGCRQLRTPWAPRWSSPASGVANSGPRY
ncbi:hypothetical protein PC116_g5048 [Phytophthora cactorum]|uniref:Uncharacterized protein n=1 Tax=Phytophthora cactorum TaxID=29920 RepID=A0A8T1EHR1_9STRA|nr:hypothetical protein PC114_g2787 [Phytophthora cactorum]KAG2952733.1 hypothetical protein PC117_g2607 [Phytophthora cactorum]KAG3039519.1 hypothetical protein PC119_g2146 [Phytophthora cactorum]KAG3189319.1 hypothetical protein C6341_g2333 [Phytophthora cactorum]KAG4247169.1 hypothetical protein PC116_g5048 [Phytophthora cactorum]